MGDLEQLQQRMQESMEELGRAMAPQAQEVAQQFADENEVGIEDVFVMASPSGEMRASLLVSD